MALVDVLTDINSVLTFYERVRNLKDRSIITQAMFDEMESQILDYLEGYFPPPPPPS